MYKRDCSTRRLSIQYFLFLNACVASVFSKASISGTTSKMRDAMELVASRVDGLGKTKIIPQPNQTTATTVQPQPAQSTSTAVQSKPKPRKTKAETAYAEWDFKQGTETQRRLDREQRCLAREAKQKKADEELARKVKALQAIFDDDEQEEEEAPPEPDPPVPTVPEKPAKAQESVGARNKRYELERRRKEKAKRDAEKAKAAENPLDPDPPRAKSPKKGKSPARSTASKTPKIKQKPGNDDDDGTTSREVGDRTTKGAKVPKQKEKARDDDATGCKIADQKQKAGTKGTDEGDGTTSRKVGTRSTHIDDANYELDLTTGKFVTKTKKQIPRDDDDDDIEMEEVDDEDIDEDYDPDKDPDQGDDDDDDEQLPDAEADDDDFEIPPLRSKKAVKPSDNSMGKEKPKKKSKESDEALADLADFVADSFPKPSKERKQTIKKHDACINPVEAARFRKAMRDEVLVLERAVRNGKNVSETYHTMVIHIIQACKDMNYEIPTDIEVDDIFPTIEDPSCKAWQLKLQGVQTAGEGELNISKTDNSGMCVAKKKFGIKDVMEYAEEVSSDWTDLKRKNFIATMKKVIGNMTVAHRMVADAAQEMVSLLDEVELPLWIKLADIMMRPLVHIEVPELTIMCEEAKQISRENDQHWDQMTKITTIMESQCLPFLPTSWGYDKSGRAKKMIAGIIYKYVKDRMYDDKVETAAKEASEKFALNSTTMNRHILGKKYEGGKALTSKPRRPVAQKISATTRPIEKSKDKAVVEADEDEDDDDEEPQPSKKSKGKGTGKSSRITRSAQKIRDESNSDKQKKKAKKRKADEAELEEEENADPDMPTPKERAAALKALAAKGPVKGGLKIIH